MRWKPFIKTSKLRLIFISGLHALLLTFLTLYWMSVGTWEFGDEVVVERMTQLRYLIFSDDDPTTEKFKKNLLLVNCSYDKMLVPYEDEFGSGTRPITDRKKLTDLLHIINESKSQPDYTIWDLFLDYPSVYDSALVAELRKLDRVVLSTYSIGDGSLFRPYGDLNFALAQYSTMSGTFLKYRLLQNDSVAFVPLKLYESQRNEDFSKWAGFAFSDRGWWLNSFIVDLPIRKVHMDTHEITVWNVGEALENFTPVEIQEMVKGRLLVFGDFYENDLHDTFLGTQPGPLILVNAYLGILNDQPRITFLLFSLLFFLYFFTTIYVLHFRDYRSRVMSGEKKYKLRATRFLFKYLTYIFIFAIYSVSVYLVTGKHVQLLLFALYFNLVDYALGKYDGRVKAFLKLPQAE